ncbi:MAG: holin [Prevotella sp.]|nr:holin [Prevotella sp.]
MDWKSWIKAAGVRAIKTAAQTAVALIGTGAVGFTDLDWVRIASVAGVAAVLSLLTSLAGLPEVETKE